MFVMSSDHGKRDQISVPTRSPGFAPRSEGWYSAACRDVQMDQRRASVRLCFGLARRTAGDEHAALGLGLDLFPTASDIG